MRTRTIVAALAAALLLSGCTPPSRQYVAADGLGMYFALPSTWQAVPAAQLKTAEKGWSDDAGNVFLQTVRWQGAWTAAGSNANAVLAAKPSGQPVVFAFVRDLIGVEQQGIGADPAKALRDLVVPASTLPTAAIRQSNLTAAGFRGIRQVATYAVDGTDQTTTVVSMLAPSKDRVYVLIVRCSRDCYTANRTDIGAIIDSLTFKEPRA